MNRRTNYHLATWVFKPIIQFAREKNIGEEKIWKTIGIPEQALFTSKQQVSYDLLDRLVLLILAETNDLFYGIELGAEKNMLSGHLIDPLLRSCDKVFDIIRKIEEYNAVLSDFIYIKATETNDTFIARFLAADQWILQYPISSRIVRDFILSFFYKFILEYSNNKAIPRKILMSNPLLVKHFRLHPTKSIFNITITSSQDFDCILYDSNDEVPMLSANPLVRTLLESEIMRHSGLRDARKSMSFKVKAQLIELGDSILTIGIEQIAAMNHLSVRRLQQLLKLENTSFRAIMEEAKMNVIKKKLLDPSLSIKESADQIGYANTSSMYAFVKKKTGTTPGSFTDQQYLN